jgi:hypothetical protein
MIRLEEQSVVLHLSDEGRRVLRQVGVSVPDTPGVQFDVQETTNHGLWVRLDYSDGRHVLLIRWNYILAMDINIGEMRTEALVNLIRTVQPYARNHYAAVQRLQEPELYDHQESEEALRPDGNQEVLQLVPQAHGTQRSEVAEIGE